MLSKKMNSKKNYIYSLICGKRIISSGTSTLHQHSTQNEFTRLDFVLFYFTFSASQSPLASSISVALPLYSNKEGGSDQLPSSALVNIVAVRRQPLSTLFIFCSHTCETDSAHNRSTVRWKCVTKKKTSICIGIRRNFPCQKKKKKKSAQRVACQETGAFFRKRERFSMFEYNSHKYEQLLVRKAAQNALAESLALIINVGASAEDSNHSGPHEGDALGRDGGKRLSTNLFHLKKCKELTNRMRNASIYSLSLTNPSPFVSVLDNEIVYLDKYARVAERLAASTRQAPQQKFKDAGTIISSLFAGGIHTEEIFEVLLVLLKVQQTSAIIVCSEVSVPAVQLGLDLAVAYVLTLDGPSALIKVEEALGCLKQIIEPHPARAHLRAKLTLAAALALLGEADYRGASTKAKEALDLAESLYTETTGLKEYQLVGALCQAASVGGGDEEISRLLGLCDGVLSGSNTKGGNDEDNRVRNQRLFAFLPLLKLHCSVLHRADVALRAPAVAHARKRLLEAVKNASTKGELEAIEQRLRAEAAIVDEKARNLKLTVIRQCEHITSICDLLLRRGLATLGPETVSASRVGGTFDVNVIAVCGFVGVIGARAAARVDRQDAARRFASASDSLMAPLLGLGHPLVVLNRISLGCAQLYRGQSTTRPSTVLRAFIQLSASATAANNRVSDEQLVRIGTDALKAMDVLPSAADIMKALEETLEAVMANDTMHGRDFGALLSAIATLYGQYVDAGEKTKASNMLALWAHALADLLGPQHPLTLAKIDAFIVSRDLVAPPRINPSGGVVPLLTSVAITSESHDCEIFIAYDGETPTNAVGVNSSVSYSASGPIVLDRAGTVILKAAAFRDQKRSGCVEARFVVQPSSAK